MEKFWKTAANLVGLIALVLLAWWFITLIP